MVSTLSLDHSAGNSASHGFHVAPRKVTFNVPDFPLPMERRPVRVGKNTGRPNPGFVRPGDPGSNPASLLSKRPSRTADGT